jgi:antitoxin (DNA-binding transcriptional repressor) of toxin-antitoxin stability system
MTKRTQVGVREIRQNLSVYLDRVKKGETFHVTEFGRVVALLAPLPAERLSPLERMVREGRAIAPTGSLKDHPPPRPAPPGAPSSEEILRELREE